MFFTYYFSIPWISSLCDRTFFSCQRLEVSSDIVIHLFISSFTFSLSLRWIRSLRVKSNNFTISSPVASSFKNSFKAWNNLFHTEKHFVSLLETKCFPCLKLLVSNKVETNYEIALLILLNGGIWRLQFDLIHDEEQVKGWLFTYKQLVYRPYRRKVKELEELDVL